MSRNKRNKTLSQLIDMVVEPNPQVAKSEARIVSCVKLDELIKRMERMEYFLGFNPGITITKQLLNHGPTKKRFNVAYDLRGQGVWILKNFKFKKEYEAEPEKKCDGCKKLESEVSGKTLYPYGLELLCSNCRGEIYEQLALSYW